MHDTDISMETIPSIYITMAYLIETMWANDCAQIKWYMCTNISMGSGCPGTNKQTLVPYVFMYIICRCWCRDADACSSVCLWSFIKASKNVYVHHEVVCAGSGSL